MKISTCDFCSGHGYIEVCEGIGPKVSCPKCVDKHQEIKDFLASKVDELRPSHEVFSIDNLKTGGK